MTETVFYVNINDKLNFISKLCEKIITAAGEKIVILTAAEPEIQQKIDETLWTAIPNSFLAHEIANDNFTAVNSPIIITAAADWAFRQKDFPIVLNLPFLPHPHENIQKMIILAARNDDELKAARELYQAEKKAGIKVTHHDMINFS